MLYIYIEFTGILQEATKSVASLFCSKIPTSKRDTGTSSGKEKSMVKINGESLDIVGKTVSEYLATTNYDTKRIAVERNGEIVFKSEYNSTVLEDGDSVEVVSFVGGGWYAKLC